MSEAANKNLLDRELAKAKVAATLSSDIDLLDLYVNYGSNLIPRCLVTSDKILANAVVLAVLLKHAVTMLDAISILIRRGAMVGAVVSARSLLEAAIYCSWILQSDKEVKASYYYVWDLRDKLNSLDRLVDGTSSNREFREATKSIDFDWNYEGRPHTQEVKEEQNLIRQALETSEFSKANVDFAQLTRRGDRPRYTKWFQPLGPATIRAVAKLAGMQMQYDVFYKDYSAVTHSHSIDLHLGFNPETISLSQIRTSKDAQTLLRVVNTVPLSLYRLVLEHYRPGEVRTFLKKYLEEWRPMRTDLTSKQ